MYELATQVKAKLPVSRAASSQDWRLGAEGECWTVTCCFT